MTLATMKARLKRGAIGVVYYRVRFRRHFAFARYCRNFIRGKTGLEIGGPTEMFRRRGVMPLYPSAARIDNCNFAHQTIWEGAVQEGKVFNFDDRRPPGNQDVMEATDLRLLGSGSYDFVISSHTLEHVANPLLALSEWTRVFKEHGTMLLALLHKDGTFDHARPVTTLPILSRTSISMPRKLTLLISKRS